MKEHVVTGLTHFNITTDSYEPGMVLSDDITILSAEYTPDNRYLRIYIPVHAGERWALADFVIQAVRDYKDKNPGTVASFRFIKREDWDGPNSPHADQTRTLDIASCGRAVAYVSIWFSETVNSAQPHVEKFRTFLMDSLREFYSNASFS